MFNFRVTRSTLGRFVIRGFPLRFFVPCTSSKKRFGRKEKEENKGKDMNREVKIEGVKKR